MAEFEVGNKVAIIEHQNEKYIGECGEIMHIGHMPKSISQPVNLTLPKMESESIIVCY